MDSALNNRSERKFHISADALKLFAFALITIAIIAGIFLYINRPSSYDTLSLIEPKDGLEVHFLDVGQADASLIICDGKAMLIDGGNAADSSFIYSYLKKYNIDSLEYIICTHPHEDHAGGLAGALNFAKAKKALCSYKEFDASPFESFLSYLEKQNVKITVPRAGQKFRLGSAKFTVLAPADPGHDNVNNDSLVLRLTYGKTSFLFTGDAEYEEEHEIIDFGKKIKSTVLKVGHHGSSTSSCYEFLYKVDPQIAVISVGDNSYGHPSDEVLSRLEDCGARVFRTDECGTIIMKSDGRSLEIITEK